MLVSAAWIVPAAFAAINRVVQGRLNGWNPPTTQELLFEGGDWLIYGLLTPAVFAIARRWPLTRPHLTRRVVLHLCVSLLFCAAWATGGKLLQLLLAFIFNPQALRAAAAAAGDQLWLKAGRDWLGWIFVTLPFGVAVYLCMVGAEHAIRYFLEARDRELQLSRLSEQLAGARFSALQAQLNPHFLFNTLNTIAVLVRDGNKTGATQMVEQLSDMLRRTLGRHRANEVTLGEEMEVVRQYLSIEQVRFSDRLRPTLEVDESLLSAAVPGFALQHLVENAVRHGIARRAGAGAARVAGRRDGDVLELSVSDDGAGIDAAGAGQVGHGLQNTRERLRALYGERASLVVVGAVNAGTVATLRIPYRELVVESDAAAR
jgi:two-component system LytT family sensor kinase